MREITENLHRSELTALERSEQIEEWRVLCEQEAKVLQLGTPSPGGTRRHRPPRLILEVSKRVRGRRDGQNFRHQPRCSRLILRLFV